MPKLIKLLHPYEFEKISHVSDFLVFVKNTLRIVQKKGCWEKKDGILIPVRWSRDFNSWVVDRGTGLKRDLDGITLSNIDSFYCKDDPIYTAIVNVLKSVNSNDDFNIFGNKRNLIKNSVKFISFEYIDQDNVYPIGIYNFCKTKKRIGINCSCNYGSKLFDNSEKTLESIAATHNTFKNPERLNLKESYIDVYREFVANLKSQTYYFTDVSGEKYSIIFKDIMSENTKIKPVKTELKDIRNIINSKNVLNRNQFANNRKDIIFIILTKYFGDFLKSKLKLTHSEGIVFFEEMTNTQFKITGSKILEEKISFKPQKKNVNFKDNNYLLLPRTY